MNAAFRVGDAVRVPSDYCPGCGGRTGPMSGLVTGVETRPHDQLADEHPGPYFTVLVDHLHNGGGHLVYAACELRVAHVITESGWSA